jgi:hypothetical protein
LPCHHRITARINGAGRTGLDMDKTLGEGVANHGANPTAD